MNTFPIDFESDIYEYSNDQFINSNNLSRILVQDSDSEEFYESVTRPSVNLKSQVTIDHVNNSLEISDGSSFGECLSNVKINGNKKAPPIKLNSFISDWEDGMNEEKGQKEVYPADDPKQVQLHEDKNILEQEIILSDDDISSSENDALNYFSHNNNNANSEKAVLVHIMSSDEEMEHQYQHQFLDSYDLSRDSICHQLTNTTLPHKRKKISDDHNENLDNLFENELSEQPQHKQNTFKIDSTEKENLPEDLLLPLHEHDMETNEKGYPVDISYQDSWNDELFAYSSADEFDANGHAAQMISSEKPLGNHLLTPRMEKIEKSNFHESKSTDSNPVMIYEEKAIPQTPRSYGDDSYYRSDEDFSPIKNFYSISDLERHPQYSYIADHFKNQFEKNSYGKKMNVNRKKNSAAGIGITDNLNDDEFAISSKISTDDPSYYKLKTSRISLGMRRSANSLKTQHQSMIDDETEEANENDYEDYHSATKRTATTFRKKGRPFYYRKKHAITKK